MCCPLLPAAVTCAFAPCATVANSNGVCTPISNSAGYTCSCITGFFWDSVTMSCQGELQVVFQMTACSLLSGAFLQHNPFFTPTCCSWNLLADFRRISISASRTWLAFTGGSLSFDAARQRCIAEGGDLAAIYNAAEVDAVTAAFAPSAPWIGLRSKNGAVTLNKGEWMFLRTSATPPWDNWGSGEPNNFVSQEGVCANQNPRWNDLPCSTLLPYLCEIGKL